MKSRTARASSTKFVKEALGLNTSFFHFQRLLWYDETKALIPTSSCESWIVVSPHREPCNRNSHCFDYTEIISKVPLACPELFLAYRILMNRTLTVIPARLIVG